MPTPHNRRLLVVLGAALALLFWASWPEREAPDRPVVLVPERTVSVAASPRVGAQDPPDRAPSDTDPRPLRAIPVVLANGLELIVVEDHSAPTIAAHVAFGVGAASDPEDLPGTAHLLEHLMFSGTTRLGTASWKDEAPAIDDQREISAWLAAEDDPDERRLLERELSEAHAAADRFALPAEFPRLLGELGGTRVNAFTSLELTDYHVVIPSNRLEPWAVLFAEELSNPVLRTFVNERAVVDEERRLRSSSRCASVSADLFATLFEGHPYSSPVGGTAEGLRRANIGALEAFFDTWYTPDNAVVVLVGDLDPVWAREIVEQTFGAWLPRRAPVRPEIAVPSNLSGIRRVEGEAPNSLRMAWSLGVLEPGDIAALHVFGSAFRDILRSDTASDVRIGNPNIGLHRFRHGGVLEVQMPCRDAAVCERAAVRAVQRIRDGAVTEGATTAARRWAWVGRLQGLEDHQDQALHLVRGWSRGELPATQWAQLVGMRSVTAEQVVEVVRRHLDPSRYVVIEPGDRPRVQTGTSPTVSTAVEDGRVSDFYREILEIPVPDIEPGWKVGGRDWTESADGRVIAVPNPSNTLFQADLVWPTGWRGSPALCTAFASWLSDRSAADAGAWGRSLGRWGVSIDLRTCSWDQVSLRLSGPGEFAQRALDLVTARLRDPTFVSDRTRHAMQAARQGHETRWRSLLFGPIHAPSREWLEAQSTSTLRDLLLAFGRVAPDLWFAGPQRASDLTLGLGPRSAPIEPPPLMPVAQTTLEVRSSGRSVLVVRAGHPYDPEQEALYQLYERWLTGFTGVVAEHVRGERGAAYAIDAAFLRGRWPGEPNTTRIHVPTTRAFDVVEALVDVLTTPTAPSARWERVLATTEESLWSGHLPFRKAPAQIAAWRDRGIDGDVREVAWRMIKQVDRRRFERFLADEAALPLRIRVDGKDVDPDSLRRFGVVHELR